MKKVKILFNQALIISTAILFIIGVESAICHFFIEGYEMNWSWYIPLSIVFSGFLCAVPTWFLLGIDDLSKTAIWVRIVVHFVLVGGIVSLCGFLFKWYSGVMELLPILGMYTLIYAFVWAASGWLAKTDEKKINDAIKDFQDME